MSCDNVAMHIPVRCTTPLGGYCTQPELSCILLRAPFYVLLLQSHNRNRAATQPGTIRPCLAFHRRHLHPAWGHRGRHSPSPPSPPATCSCRSSPTATASRYGDISGVGSNVTSSNAPSPPESSLLGTPPAAAREMGVGALPTEGMLDKAAMPEGTCSACKCRGLSGGAGRHASMDLRHRRLGTCGFWGTRREGRALLGLGSWAAAGMAGVRRWWELRRQAGQSGWGALSLPTTVSTQTRPSERLRKMVREGISRERGWKAHTRRHRRDAPDPVGQESALTSRLTVKRALKPGPS
jgi:hypothetical protein